MKFTRLTLPVFLTAGIVCAYGSSLPAELGSISSRSNIEAIVGRCEAGAAATVLLAATVSSSLQTPPIHLLRCMWGE